MLSFSEVPPAAGRLLEQRYGSLMSQGSPAPLEVRFARPPPARSRSVLTTAGVRAAADDDARFFLMDGRGRRGQLPATLDDRVLWVDPDFDARPRGALQQLVDLLLHWQAARHGMLALKGAAAVLPEGGVALVGFGGSGKSSLLLGLLDDASCYVGEERLFLTGPRTVAALAGPVLLSLGRSYRLPAWAEDALPRGHRLALRLVPNLLSGAPRPVAGLLRHLMADRWLSLQPEHARPGLAVTTSTSLDVMVLLLPSEIGELHIEPLSSEDLRVSVAHHVAYLEDVSLLALRAMFGTALPALAPWVVSSSVEGRVASLPSFLEGVAGWKARVPPASNALDVAAALRRVLGAAPQQGRAQ